MVRLEGPRILLREWRADELDAMHRWLGDPAVKRFLTWGARTVDDSARHLAECVAEQGRPDRMRYFLAIELAGRVIGDAGFEWVGGADRRGRLGYFLEPACWGHGYAAEAAGLLLDFAFRTCGAISMGASCDAANLRSERVMLKLGMRRDEEIELPGRREYAITRDEWSRR